jgi:hypothetical protein
VELQIRLSELHPAQKQVLAEAKRFNALCCGRRWGKSELASDILVNTVIDQFPAGYFTPIYKLLEGTYARCLDILEPIVVRKNENQFIECMGGNRIDFWTLDNEYAGRSKKYKTVVLDECAFAKNLWDLWTKSIRATLADYEGDAWFMSTPKGKNDFFKLWSRGKSGEDNWASWQMSTYTNPFINSDEIDSAKADLPEAAFSQEYMAEFLENSANPFNTTYISQCTYPLSKAPAICYGVDLGQSQDYTVIIGLDRGGSVCYFERFKDVDWRTVKDKIIHLPKADLAIDATGLGGPIAEDITRARQAVERFLFTPKSKQELMEGLAVAIEGRKITFPEGEITDELKNFEYEYTRTGVRYTAPAGLHDDCVCALALAWYKFKSSVRNNGEISIMFA